jgi:hypothetical protein
MTSVSKLALRLRYRRRPTGTELQVVQQDEADRRFMTAAALNELGEYKVVSDTCPQWVSWNNTLFIRGTNRELDLVWFTAPEDDLSLIARLVAGFNKRKNVCSTSAEVGTLV